MKRYIYAMAIPKKEAKIRINSYADIILRHVIECVVYSNWQGTRHHWIAELSAWLSKISQIKCKSKLTRRDYEEGLFASYGDELSDAEWLLQAYHDSSVRKSRYPDFEIDEDMIQRLFDTLQRFMQVSLKYLTSPNTCLEEDWAIILDQEVFI